MIKMPSRAQSGTETINADYTHVYSDLRRIGLLAELADSGIGGVVVFIK